MFLSAFIRKKIVATVKKHTRNSNNYYKLMNKLPIPKSNLIEAQFDKFARS